MVVKEPVTHKGHKRAWVMLWALLNYYRHRFDLKNDSILFGLAVTPESEQLLKTFKFLLASERSVRRDRYNLYELRDVEDGLGQNIRKDWESLQHVQGQLELTTDPHDEWKLPHYCTARAISMLPSGRREVDDVVDQVLKVGKEGNAEAVSLFLIPAEGSVPLVERLLGIEQHYPDASCFNLIRASSSETTMVGSPKRTARGSARRTYAAPFCAVATRLPGHLSWSIFAPPLTAQCAVGQFASERLMLSPWRR